MLITLIDMFDPKLLVTILALLASTTGGEGHQSKLEKNFTLSHSALLPKHPKGRSVRLPSSVRSSPSTDPWFLFVVPNLRVVASNTKPQTINERRQYARKLEAPVRGWDSEAEWKCQLKLYDELTANATTMASGEDRPNDRLVFMIPLIIAYWHHRHPEQPLPLSEIHLTLQEFGNEAEAPRQIVDKMMAKMGPNGRCLDSLLKDVTRSGRQMSSSSNSSNASTPQNADGSAGRFTRNRDLRRWIEALFLVNERRVMSIIKTTDSGGNNFTLTTTAAPLDATTSTTMITKSPTSASEVPILLDASPRVFLNSSASSLSIDRLDAQPIEAAPEVNKTLASPDMTMPRDPKQPNEVASNFTQDAELDEIVSSILTDIDHILNATLISPDMEISVRQINLKPTLIKNLLNNGIILVSHLNCFDVPRLMKKTKLSRDDCEKIIAATKPKRPYYFSQASDLMLNPFKKFRTLIKGVDQILGGGISCGHLIEFSGEAGSGKSNLCAQIGTLVMINEASGGEDGDVLIIHTEGEGKLKLAIKRFHALAASMNQENVIDGKLQVMNCSTELELGEMINRLPGYLDKHPKVRLIIIDSMTCAYIAHDRNPDRQFYNKRSLHLTKIAKSLGHLAWTRRLAIVTTNHVSYDHKAGHNRPALGKFWSHMSQTKIYLERMETANGLARFAQVHKGAVTAPSKVSFRITNDLFDISGY